jgi:hypothetical protein
MQSKRKFVQDYIDKLNAELSALCACEPQCIDKEENALFDLILEIRNVFSKEMPEIENVILIRNGTGLRDGNSVIGILRLYLLNEDKTDNITNDFEQNNSKLDDAFLSYASDVLADTNSGLSGTKIVEYCNSYALDYSVSIPHGCYPFPNTVPTESLSAEADRFSSG